MDCDCVEVPRGDGFSDYVCRREGCGNVMQKKPPGKRVGMTCRLSPASPPPSGPGTELRAIFSELRVKPKKGCKCARIARLMNRLGPVGCRQHRAELLERLRDNYDLYGLADKITAAVFAIVKRLPKNLDDLFDLAIERAEAKITSPAGERAATSP